MRALWSGHLTFGLITIPVGLYSALESGERVSFRLLHRKDLSPIKYKKFCAAEDIEVGNDEVVKGYEVEEEKFAIVEEEELDKVQEEAGEGDRAIEILQFVDFSSINPLLIEKPYYVGPQKGGEKAYAVLREALSDARRAGVARFYLRTKPILAALIPAENALALAVLRSYEELRDPKEVPLPDRTGKPAEIKMARALIEEMTEEWDPTEHPNEYRRALEKLLASKRRFALKEPETEEGEEGKVVDLMEALRRSVAAGKGRKKTSGRKRGAA